MKRNFGFSFLGLSVLAFAVFGCLGEERFAGSKEIDATITNGPFTIKIVTVGGAQYLAILNTNYRANRANGSLQFFSISTNPTMSTAIDPVVLPSNVSDFEIINDDLFVLNRNRSELWVYDLSGTTFSRRQKATGGDFDLDIAVNPTQMFQFTRNARPASTSTGATVLAIVAQSTGSISLVDPSTVTILNPANLVSGTIDAGLVRGRDIYGARFYMTARIDSATGARTRLGVGGLRRLGVGITGSLFYGYAGSNVETDSDEYLVSFNALGLAAYSYNLKTFKNNSNFTWELPDWQNDKRLADNVTIRRGTKENGFRGMDKDDAGNVYLTSRTDNALYVLSKSDIIRAKDDGEANTYGFTKNERTRVVLDFDTDTTDKIFPRIGAIVVEKADYQSPNLNNDGASATLAWVASLGEGKVYRVNLTTSAVTHSVDVGTSLQRLLRVNSGGVDVLYVADTREDKIYVLNPDDLSTLSTIQLQ